MQVIRTTTLLLFVAAFVGLAVTALGQTFDSGSTGADGALILNDPGSIVFDPTAFDPPLDTDGDGVYHFTTIEIGSSTFVRLAANVLGTRPVIWLASGDVIISGRLDLSGESGHSPSSPARQAISGAGGFYGGMGSTTSRGATPGEGPGAGNAAIDGYGGGAGHVLEGSSRGNTNDGTGGSTYGNPFLFPLIGGSGGGGGGVQTADGNRGSGGGAGGGAILIASSTRIQHTGFIEANGGNSGSNVPYGGSGSGGAVRLMAPQITGNGTIRVNGGNIGVGDQGSHGRVRLEAFQHNFSGSTHSDTRFVTPGRVFPNTMAPSVRITSVGGIAAPDSPRGSFAPADLEIDESGPVTIELEASHIPVGTVVNLALTSEEQDRIEIDSTPLAGTLEASTATATATIPPGFSRFTVQASWTP